MSGEFETVFDVRKIMEYLPHRYPFLLVDRVVEFTPGESLRAYKNITFNEEFFQGHFPGMPIMPGVLILEALAQAGGLLIAPTLPNLSETLFLFTGMDKVKFRRRVMPGDRLDMECRLLRHKMRLYIMEGRALVNGELAAEAQMQAACVNREVLYA